MNPRKLSPQALMRLSPETIAAIARVQRQPTWKQVQEGRDKRLWKHKETNEETGR